MRRTIQDVDETVDAFAQKGARLQGFIGIAQGIAGSFAVAQSGLKLFGIESDNVEKSLEKTATVIELLSGLEALNTAVKQKNVIITGIQNGIRAITVRLAGQQAVAEAAAAAATGTATIAQRGLNAAMAANPIGLLIVGITTLVTTLALFGDENETAAKTQAELNAEIEKGVELAEQYNNLGIGGLADRQKEIELLKAKGATNRQIYNAEKDLINEQIASLQGLRDTTTDNTKFLQYESQIRNLYKDLEILDVEFTKKAKEESQKRIDEANKRIETYKKERAEILKTLEQYNKDYYKKVSDLTFEIQNFNNSQYVKELNALLKKFNDEEELLNDAEENKLQKLKEAKNKKLITEAEYQTQKTEIINQYEELNKLNLDRFNTENYGLAKKQSDELLKLQLDNEKAIFENNLKSLDKQLANKKRAVATEKEIYKQLSVSQVRTLEDETKSLDKQIKAQSNLLEKRLKEREDAVRSMNESRSTEEREIYADVIKDIDALQVKTKEEISVNEALLKVKKERLDIDKKLYNDEAQKKQAEELLTLETDTAAKRKKLIEDYYTTTEKKVTDDYKQRLALIDEEIKSVDELSDFYNGNISQFEDLIDTQNEVIDIINKFDLTAINTEIDKLTKNLLTASEEEKAAIEDTLSTYEVARDRITEKGKEGAIAESESVKSAYALKIGLYEADLRSSEKAKRDKTKLEQDYNKTISDLAANTTDLLAKEEDQRTDKTKEENEKRIADWENFVATAADKVINLLGAAFNSITQARVQQLDYLKEQELAVIDAEYEAYKASTEKKTNAEKFKADKEAEFAKKKADIEAKYEKQKADAQYKNEIRQWEFTRLQAVVNLSNAILKAAPNPFLLGTTAALGIIELATIEANKPIKTYGKGGLLNGPSHAEGGIATPFGEMEGGEAVINKKSTKQFLPILSAINEAGGGIPLVNTSKMATGGVTNINNNNVDMSGVEAMLDAYFNRPIKTYVTSSDVTSAQGFDKRLRDRTSF
jgi:hypothetical protein